MPARMGVVRHVCGGSGGVCLDEVFDAGVRAGRQRGHRPATVAFAMHEDGHAAGH
jgi:hypothetical protein